MSEAGSDENLALSHSVREFTSGSPYNSSPLDTNVSSGPASIRLSDVSMSLSPDNSLQSSILAPLESAIAQIDELKKLLEECTKKVKDRVLKLQPLQAERNNCATLKEETLRPQDLDGSTKELKECKEHVKTVGDAVVAACKSSEGMIRRLMTLAQERKQNYGSNSELNSIQRVEANKSLCSEAAELEVKLKEKEMKLVQMEQERKSLTDKIEHLQLQVESYDTDFTNERQAREQLVLDNQKLKQHLKEREQFSRYNDDVVTQKFVRGNLTSDAKQQQFEQVHAKEQEQQECHYGLQDTYKKDKYCETLVNEVTELKVKLQEKDTALAQMMNEKKSWSEDMEVLRCQIHDYGTDFEAERQSREQLVVVSETLRQQLKEREEQFSKFSDEFTTNKFAQERLATDNNQLQQQIDRLYNQCEQLRRSQEQKDERLTQLSNQISAEVQLKESILAENQNLRDELQMKESKFYVSNTAFSIERQQFTTGTDRFSHSLEEAVDVKQLQLSGQFTSLPPARQNSGGQRAGAAHHGHDSQAQYQQHLQYKPMDATPNHHNYQGGQDRNAGGYHHIPGPAQDPRSPPPNQMCNPWSPPASQINQPNFGAPQHQSPFGGREQPYRQRSGPLEASGGGGTNSDPCPMCLKRFANYEQLVIHAATCNYDPSAH
ncbi:golgin subfamily A member 6-like protein 7 isoform X2 [Dysidea avara]|uniref:golgin subfamily A member 6-like protein 7 isoform X2 n=1 Tax=Dysidea avara TaxID=196820 RepID=UPI003333969F